MKDHFTNQYKIKKGDLVRISGKGSVPFDELPVYLVIGIDTFKGYLNNKEISYQLLDFNLNVKWYHANSNNPYVGIKLAFGNEEC